MTDSRATSAARLLPRSAELAASVGPGPLAHVVATGSTNTDLVNEARTGATGGAVLVADHQTAGRGRLDRRWDDDPGGCLLVSLRVPVAESDAAGVARAVGAAARAAADQQCTETVMTKWPNDLVVEAGPTPGKLAGVLAELVPGPTACVVVGVGINILAIGRRLGATSVVECGGPADRDGLLAALLRELAPRLRDGSGVLDELRAHSATLGRRVRAEMPGGVEIIGDAVELAPDGSLVIADDDGRRHTVGVGDVVHLRAS